MLPRVEGVEYIGIVGKKELPKPLCKAKALILPSSYENPPYVCLENSKLWINLSRNTSEFTKRLDYIDIAKKYVNVVESLIFGAFTDRKNLNEELLV